MTTPTAALVPSDVPDSAAAQEIRWNAWKARGAAADRITHRRVRMVAAVLAIALVGVMIAVAL
jgi:hypothetical protein